MVLHPLRQRELIRRYGNIGYLLVGANVFKYYLWQLCKGIVLFLSSGLLTCLLLCYYVYVRHNYEQSRTLRTTYTITDLGTLPGSIRSNACGINNLGEIVGYCDTDKERRQAFLWQNGVMKELPNLGGDNWAISINDKAQIVGASNKCAVLWQNGKVHALDNVPKQSIGRAINDRGEIVGDSHNGSEAFLWYKGKVTDLGHLPERRDTYATGINAKRQVAGASGAQGYVAFHAFVWQQGKMTDLGTLDGSQSEARALNDKEHIVGRAYVARNTWHACLWKENKVFDLGTLPFDPHSIATAINNKEVIVGYVGLPGASAKRHAFAFAENKMNDLNALVPKNSGWVLEQANGINDKGLIVGTGVHNGQCRAFLLTPSRR